MMDASFGTRQRRTIAERWRIGLIALVAAAFGAGALVYVPSRETHDAILSTLRMIELQHASLQRDVLQARAGLLRNYDPLVGAIAGLNATTETLRTLLDSANREGASGFDNELSAIARSIVSDERLVDRFKSSNSLLQNSLEIFNQLLSRRYQDPYYEGQPPTERSGHLGNLMMRFAANPSADLELQIRAELDGLRALAGNPRDDAGGIASHAIMIMETLPLVDHTALALQGSASLQAADRLRTGYLKSYDRKVLQSTRYRVMLGSVSLALFAWAAMLVQRSRETNRQLKQQLRFEATLDEVKRRFAETSMTMDAAVGDALRLLGDFFEGPRGDFVIYNPADGDITHDFGAMETARLSAIVAEVRDKDGKHAPDAKPSKGDHLTIIPRGATADALVTVRLDAQNTALLRLAVSSRLLERGADVAAMLEQAAECLVNCVRSVQDREEREALQARLDHAQRLEAVGTLAGGIAHEFNNILLAMMGYSEMALDRSPAGSDAARYIKEIMQGGQRAKLVIDQVLTLSRRGGRNRTPFDICEAVRDVLPLLEVSLPKHVSLDVDIPHRHLTVTGNPVEVQQTIMNLCRNAAQACHESGWVGITLAAVELRTRTTLSHGRAPPGSYAVLRVSDTGSGIEADALPHIFEPFFTTRSEAGGTGLGLAAVHGTVAGMAGHLNVQSSPGAGTRFELYLPITRRHPVAPSDFSADHPFAMGVGQTVLIAERDSGSRSMYEEKAAALGYEPIGVASLEAAAGWISKPGHAADLVILDLALWPGEPDPSTIARHFAPVPTLLLGDPAGISAADKRSLGQLPFLRKPVTSSRLAWAISTTLGEAERRTADGTIALPM
jgi:signal transduction histidine kinase